MIHFLLCNLFITVIIGILFAAKRLFQNSLTSRMQYHLWYLFLGLLAVPFIPVHRMDCPNIFSWMKFKWLDKFMSLLKFKWLEKFIRLAESKYASAANIGTSMDTAASESTSLSNWMNDFTLSVSRKMPSVTEQVLFGIWLAGIFVMIIILINAKIHFRILKKSALPLQNNEVRRLYYHCLNEINITKDIPVYSTAFLKSPIIVGLLKPCIYLPIHLISDYNPTDMRYMLLHELQHYKHKDALSNYLMNTALALYWFNPFVWYALKEMRNDREVACDTSVLEMLKEDDYIAYGNTLINFAEKVSRTSFPFAAGIGGNMKQIKRRILNIASYEKPSLRKRLQSGLAFGLTATIFLILAPALSVYAADGTHYQWNYSSENISHVNYATYFDGYEGSFVLYDLENDSWNIYDMERATTRVSPNSTFKIYTALFGLEEGVITPNNSLIPWNKENYPFETWNADQNLCLAMDSSVNWYFQKIDEELGATAIQNDLREIDYGNEDMSGDFSTYWMESSLKISPVEQVELLTKLYNNAFDFAPENIAAVKDSICIFSSESGNLYGKTGTGRVNGQNVNGWFIGYVETAEHTYFFAVNIQSDKDAAGSTASEIALSILSDLNIWEW